MGLENPLHLLVILAVLLLLFGAKRLPDMGRSLGDGIRTFRDAMNGPAAADQPVLDRAPAAAEPAPPVAAESRAPVTAA